MSTDYSAFLFHEGTNAESYRLFCVTPVEAEGRKGYRFRVWAPHALAVSVVGDFNGWDAAADPMTKVGGGCFEAVVVGPKVYDRYKFAVVRSDGTTVMKADPYALHAETAPANASRIYEFRHAWRDGAYLARREGFVPYVAPISVYEVHLGSWRRHADGSPYGYLDLARTLVPYVKEMGFTHVEFLPVTEYPFDGSWGYQVTGMFAPTSRYGTPDDFMELVDAFHEAGIGVIVDWVGAHFPKDEFGLYRFDGTCLYEYADARKREHREWGTVVYDYGKPEVRSFLISSANFWLDVYHVDGIRVDAVASMLYLDYARKAGEWRPNAFGGNHNLEAIEFLRQLNSAVLTRHKGAMMIAEESTAFPMVTKPPYDGGLGFNFKWNMGWMNDTLRYLSADPARRKDLHSCMTFSLTYAFGENYVLPLSHDEVVHGKRSLIEKTVGDYEEKFRTLKTYYAFMAAHPGKKLLFMGGEFAQFIEWDHTRGLDWCLLDYPSHRGMQTYVRDLNRVYRTERAFYDHDDSPASFRWAVADDDEQSVFAFERISAEGERVLCVFNFSPVARTGYRVGVPAKGTYASVFDSESEAYGGSRVAIRLPVRKGESHGLPYHVTMDIAAYSAVYLKYHPQKGGKS